MAIRPEYQPRLRLVNNYWRVTPAGVWKKLTGDERKALKLAHLHAAKLNSGIERITTKDQVIEAVREHIHDHTEAGRPKQADIWKGFLRWLRNLK